MHEFAVVCKGNGGELDDIDKWCFMKYNKIIQSMNMRQEMANRHQQMVCDWVWETVNLADIPLE